MKGVGDSAILYLVGFEFLRLESGGLSILCRNDYVCGIREVGGTK